MAPCPVVQVTDPSISDVVSQAPGTGALALIISDSSEEGDEMILITKLIMIK